MLLSSCRAVSGRPRKATISVSDCETFAPQGSCEPWVIILAKKRSSLTVRIVAAYFQAAMARKFRMSAIPSGQLIYTFLGDKVSPTALGLSSDG
jgi:hypothetical protein